MTTTLDPGVKGALWGLLQGTRFTVARKSTWWRLHALHCMAGMRAWPPRHSLALQAAWRCVAGREQVGLGIHREARKHAGLHHTAPHGPLKVEG